MSILQLIQAPRQLKSSVSLASESHDGKSWDYLIDWQGNDADRGQFLDNAYPKLLNNYQQLLQDLPEEHDKIYKYISQEIIKYRW